MKRFAASTGVLSLLLTVGFVLATSAEHQTVEHGHVLVLGLTFDGEGNYAIRRCVDLAGGRALRTNAHHDHLHTGRAGKAVERAGHAVIPTAPLPEVPWQNCAQLKDFFEIE